MNKIVFYSISQIEAAISILSIYNKSAIAKPSKPIDDYIAELLATDPLTYLKTYNPTAIGLPTNATSSSKSALNNAQTDNLTAALAALKQGQLMYTVAAGGLPWGIASGPPLPVDINAISASDTPSTNGGPDSITLNYTITGASAKPFFVSLSESPTPQLGVNSPFVDEVQITDPQYLSVGYHVYTFKLTPPLQTIKDFYVIDLDSHNQIAEADETNNTASFTLPPINLSDIFKTQSTTNPSQFGTYIRGVSLNDKYTIRFDPVFAGQVANAKILLNGLPVTAIPQGVGTGVFQFIIDVGTKLKVGANTLTIEGDNAAGADVTGPVQNYTLNTIALPDWLSASTLDQFNKPVTTEVTFDAIKNQYQFVRDDFMISTSVTMPNSIPFINGQTFGEDLGIETTFDFGFNGIVTNQALLGVDKLTLFSQSVKKTFPIPTLTDFNVPVDKLATDVVKQYGLGTTQKTLTGVDISNPNSEPQYTLTKGKFDPKQYVTNGTLDQLKELGGAGLTGHSNASTAAPAFNKGSLIPSFGTTFTPYTIDPDLTLESGGGLSGTIQFQPSYELSYETLLAAGLIGPIPADARFGVTAALQGQIQLILNYEPVANTHGKGLTLGGTYTVYLTAQVDLTARISANLLFAAASIAITLDGAIGLRFTSFSSNPNAPTLQVPANLSATVYAGVNVPFKASLPLKVIPGAGGVLGFIGYRPIFNVNILRSDDLLTPGKTVHQEINGPLYKYLSAPPPQPDASLTAAPGDGSFPSQLSPGFSTSAALIPSDVPVTNSTLAGAIDLGGVQGTQSVNELLVSDDDTHYVHFNLAAFNPNGGANVTLTTPDLTDGVQIALYDDELNYIGTSVVSNGVATLGLANLTAGGYYVEISTNGDSQGTIPTTLSITGNPTNLGDLAARISTPNTVIYPGQQFPVTYTVTNVGSAPTAATNARLVWSGDSTVTAGMPNLIDPSLLNIPALLPGQSYTRTLAVTPPAGITGVGYVAIQVDPNNTLIESGKDDNTADVVQVIDLPPDALAGNDTPETAADLGGLYQPIAINNLAISDPIENDFYQVYLSTPGTANDNVTITRPDGMGHADIQIIDGNGNIVADNDPSGTLGQDSAGNGVETLSFAGLPAGQYFIRVGSADGGVFNYSLSLTADPSRSGVELVNTQYLAPTELVPTLSYTIPVNVANYGSQTAFNVPVAFELVDSLGNVTTISSPTTIAHIDPGQIGTANVNITVPASFAAGDYTLEFLIDPNNTITEANKTDNIATSTVSVTGLPDVFAQQNQSNGFVDLGLQQTAAIYNNLNLYSANDHVTYQFQTGATGTSANAITLAFDPSKGNISAILYDTQGNEVTEIDSPTDGVETISLNGLVAGEYTLVVFSGDTGVPGTYNYTLGINAPAITGPALTVSSIGLDDQVLVQGETFNIESIINNISGAASGSFTAQYVLSADPTFATGVTLIGTSFTLNSIAAGASFADIRAITLPADAPIGPLYLGLILDPSGALPLTNRSNANGITNIDVLPPADALEPNSLAHPTPVTLTNDLYTVPHLNISQGDVDAFAITFTSTAGPGDFISIQDTNPSEGQLVLSLLDSKGNVVLTTSEPSALLTLPINGLPAGNYIVEVAGATQFAAASDYTLTIDPYLAGSALPGTITGGPISDGNTSGSGTDSTTDVSGTSAGSNGSTTAPTSPSGSSATTSTGTTGTSSTTTTTTTVASITQADAQAALNEAIQLWQHALGTPINLSVTIVVTPVAGSDLGTALITNFNQNGTPAAGTIHIANNAFGTPWLVDLNPNDAQNFNEPLNGTAWQASSGAASKEFDLLTAVSHELGHLLGFTSADPLFAAHIVAGPGGPSLVTGDLHLALTADDNHLANAAAPYDLMNATLTPGTRELPSALDAKILNEIDTPGNTAAASAGVNAGISSAQLVTGTAPHSTLQNGSFTLADPANANFGWASTGSITVAGNSATLAESPGTLDTRLIQTFLVPASPTTLSFTITAADLLANNGLPPDAFEAALLDAQTGADLLPTLSLSGTDAFLNLQTGGAVTLANGVSISAAIANGTISLASPITVTIDIHTLTPGQAVTLDFDLLGFAPSASSISLGNVQVGSSVTAPPTLTSFTANPGQTQHSHLFFAAGFSEDVTLPLSAFTLYQVNGTTFTPVTLVGANLSYSSLTHTATLDLAQSLLPDGNYELRLAPGSVLDSAGNPLDLGGLPYASVDTFKLAGDANGDGVVDARDALIVQDSLNITSGQPGFNPDADVDGDGQVTTADLSLVTANLTHRITPLTSPQLTILNSSNVPVSSLDFGTLARGGMPVTQTLTFRNDGQTTLTVGALQLVGANASLFGLALSGPLPDTTTFTLAAGESITLTFTFNPTTSGAIAAALQFVTNDPALNAPTQIALTAQVTSVADTAPTFISFLADPGQTQHSHLFFAAAFSKDVTVPLSAFTLYQVNGTTFTPVSLAGASVTFSTATHTATLDLAQVTLPDGFYELRLAAPMVVDALGTSLDLGNLPYVSVDTFKLAGDTNGDGVVDALDTLIVQNSLNIAPGQSGFNANADVTGDGQVDSADLALVIGNLTHRTTPLTAPKLTILNSSNIPVSSLDFGTLTRGSAAVTQTLTFRNDGQTTLTVGALQLVGANASLFGLTLSGPLPNTTTFTLAAGQSITLTFTFNPTTSGAIAAALQFVTNDPTLNAPTQIALTAQVVPIASSTPTVLLTSFLANPSATQHSHLFFTASFGEDVTVPLSAFTLYKIDGTTFTPVSLTGATLTYDPATHTVTIDLAQVALADGNYQLRLAAASVTDAVGNTLALGGTLPYACVDDFKLAGDANGDGKVNSKDTSIVKRALNALRRQHPFNVNADLNGDGLVTTTDLTLITTNLKHRITPVTAPKLTILTTFNPPKTKRNFGSVAKNAPPVTATITLRNDGSTTESLWALQLTGRNAGLFGFSLAGLPDHTTAFTLAPGESIIVNLSFNPQKVGIINSALQFQTNALERSKRVVIHLRARVTRK